MRAADGGAFGNSERLVAADRPHRPQRVARKLELQVHSQDAVARAAGDEVGGAAAVVGGRD